MDFKTNERLLAVMLQRVKTPFADLFQQPIRKHKDLLEKTTQGLIQRYSHPSWCVDVQLVLLLRRC
jgi:hypothetical protein